MERKQEVRELLKAWLKSLENKKIKQQVCYHDMEIIERRRHFELFPSGTFELFQRNLVWEDVLAYVVDPLQISSAYNTCTTFRVLLQPRMIREVFKILDQKGYIKQTDYDLIRQVSSTWAHAANKAFDKFTGQWYLNWTPDDIPGTGWKSPDNESLYLTESSFNDSFPEIIDWLDGEGYRVRVIVMNLETTSSAYHSVVDIVTRTPNLKVLILESPFGMDEDDDAFQTDNAQFPALLSVEFIKFEIRNPTFIDWILRKCPNIKSLSLPEYFNLSISKEMIEMLQSLKLERLELQKMDEWNFDSLFLMAPSWSLKSIIINSNWFELGACTLFPVLNRFGETLENLTLRNVVFNCEEFQLELPKLNTLQLTGIMYPNNLDFIMPLTSLERLEFAVTNSCKYAGVIKLVVSDNDVVKGTNLWWFLPKLKEIVTGRFENNRFVVKNCIKRPSNLLTDHCYDHVRCSLKLENVGCQRYQKKYNWRRYRR